MRVAVDLFRRKRIVGGRRANKEGKTKWAHTLSWKDGPLVSGVRDNLLMESRSSVLGPLNRVLKSDDLFYWLGARIAESIVENGGDKALAAALATCVTGRTKSR